MLASLLRALRRLHRPAGLALAAAVPTLLLGALYAYETLSREPRETQLWSIELQVNDLLRKHGRPATLRGDMVFLGIDDASLQLDGLWPEEIDASPALKLMSQSKETGWNWSREVYARLLDRLADAGAKLVIFDLMFPNPKDGDVAFRAALDRHRARVVVISQFVGPRGRGVLQQPTLGLISDPANDPRVGYASYRPDLDGKIRQISFLDSLLAYNRNAHAFQAGDEICSSLVATALRQLGHADLIPADKKPRPFRFTDIPGGSDYAPHPLWEVFSDATWQSNYQGGIFFKDKIVIVGAAAPTLHDFLATAYGNTAGPDIHLQALGAALGRDYLKSTSPQVDFATILAAGALAWIVGLLIRQPLARLGTLAAVSAAFFGVLQWLYNHPGLMPLAFTPLLVFNTGGLGGLIGEYVVERAEKARVRGVLDRLVSKDIVRELLDNREGYDALVRGQRRPVTVLFSDVRGFTTLSEAANDPAAFIAQLNEYLAEMVDVVFKYHGTLDKFIGDAVMAVWGSMHTEGPDADAREAVAAALEMRSRLAALNAKWSATGKLRLDIGIGLNHGEVIVGGLGSEDSKMEITVMGDAVNLASRLEGLTKEYGVDLLIGESVARLVSETFRLRTVDLVRVKNRKQASEVMAVIGPLSEVPPEAQELLLADYEDAILLYRRQDFAAAARLLESCLLTEPADQLAVLYLERCQMYLTEAPAPNWDGVRQMTTK